MTIDYQDRERQKVAARKMLKVPQRVQEFIVELLTFNSNRSDYFPTCITCEHWKDEKCSLFNAIPPAKTIANGCEKYLDVDLKDIPF